MPVVGNWAGCTYRLRVFVLCYYAIDANHFQIASAIPIFFKSFLHSTRLRLVHVISDNDATTFDGYDIIYIVSFVINKFDLFNVPQAPSLIVEASAEALSMADALLR